MPLHCAPPYSSIQRVDAQLPARLLHVDGDAPALEEGRQLRARHDVAQRLERVAEEVVARPARPGLVLTITPHDRQHLVDLVQA
eukprot:366458-Prymnesium_polylepis.1